MKTEKITFTGLKARGWTDGLIRRHLGEPDEVAANPHYSQAGAPMRLYALARVEAAEGTVAKEDLAARRRNGTRNRQAAAAAVATKERRLIAEIDALTIRVERQPWGDVVRDALSGNRHRQMSHETDGEFLDRMVMNYLRHEITNYHAGLDMLFARVGGRGEAYEHLKDRIEQAIYDVYPELSGTETGGAQ